MKGLLHAFWTGMLLVVWFSAMMTASNAVDQKKAAAEVVARELSFSARAQVIDARDAFLEYFAADARLFGPEPVSALERLQKSPPWGINLQWWPAEVAISADGRLAYSTGPVEIRQTASSPHPDSLGTYFTIWRKNNQNVWEVAADLGTDTPALWTEKSAPVIVRLPLFLEKPAGPVSLIEVDSAFAQKALSGLKAALKTQAAPEYRFLPPKGMPVSGVEAAEDFLLAGPSSWTVQGEIVSAFGDLGATYGSGKGGYAPGRFGFLRVWRRNPKGQWQVLAEVIKLPRE